MALDREGMSPSEVAESFTRCYGLLPIVVMKCDASILGCDLLHRARWVDASNEDVGSLDTYCYPPSLDKQVMGRANLAGCPVFYTCADARSSIREASHSRRNGHDLFRSEWAFSDGEPWQMAPLIPHDRVENMGIPFQAAWREAMAEYTLRTGSMPSDHLIALHNCIAELFFSQSYEVTSWVAHRIMQELGAAEMLIYPSLMADEKDLCHAFHTRPIDQHRVELKRVVQLHPEQGELTPLKVGTANGGVVHWTSI